MVEAFARHDGSMSQDSSVSSERDAPQPPGGAAPRSGRRAGKPSRAATLTLTIPAAVVVALTLVRLVPYDRVTPLAQLVSVTPWVGLIGVALLLVALVVRARVVAVALAVCTVLQAVWIVPFFAGSNLVTDGDASVVVLSVNALYGGANAEQIVETVRTHRVDVLAVVELTPELVERLDEAGLADLLPYTAVAAGPGPNGSGLWSATELTGAQVSEGGTFAMPSAVVQVNGYPVRVRAVHPYPPLPGRVGLWADELDALARRAHADPTRQILLGDFNATYDHTTFRALLGERFEDATRVAGDGLNLSWPADGWLPPIAALDHVVMDQGMAAGHIESIPIDGTDHRALLVQVAVRGPDGR